MAKTTESSENQNTKSKKDMFRERFLKNHPDIDPEDEEAMYGSINDDYDRNDQQLSKYKEREDKLNNMLRSNPKAANFMSAWSRGEDPEIAFVRNFGMELKDAIDDPDKMQQLADANQEHIQRIAKNQELDEQWEQNMPKSLEALQKMQEKEGISDDDMQKAYQALWDAANDVIIGVIKPETIKLMLNAVRHDADVSEAAADGEIKGRNANIINKMKKDNSTDGVPVLSGNGKSNVVPKKDMGVLGNSRPDIWKGMKVTEYKQ